ncbi:uncharacterized protein [Spinacia oleracea]|uniref:Uncharacterized protein isoform X2 n=1 Tax=Spinacia oleracea TaxID=3562 RepID=A0ABM3RD78_SPIOL|nr:uncharacterized protein LOC110789403 isoform X2 [Spinacia oleracea]
MATPPKQNWTGPAQRCAKPGGFLYTALPLAVAVFGYFWLDKKITEREKLEREEMRTEIRQEFEGELETEVLKEKIKEVGMKVQREMIKEASSNFENEMITSQLMLEHHQKKVIEAEVWRQMMLHKKQIEAEVKREITMLKQKQQTEVVAEVRKQMMLQQNQQKTLIIHGADKAPTGVTWWKAFTRSLLLDY